jgi:hypothetical protein
MLSAKQAARKKQSQSENSDSKQKDGMLAADGQKEEHEPST